MNLKDPAWHAQLQLHSKRFNYEGSINNIIQQTMLELVSANQRSQPKLFTLTFSQEPITDVAQEEARRISEIESGLIASDPVVPLPNEPPDYFYARLRDDGNSEATALYLVNEWFPNHHFDTSTKSTSELSRWLADPKVALFIRLNSSAEAFKSALPEEYAELKRYVLAEYPMKAAAIQFRTA